MNKHVFDKLLDMQDRFIRAFLRVDWFGSAEDDWYMYCMGGEL